jgi:predicted DCC family thiol-disulfide oxidoreductase YuxK
MHSDVGTTAVPYLFEVFYDGDCPICRREIALVRRLDRHRRVQLTDIAQEDFDPAEVGRTYPELMASIHGRTPDGAWVEGVEVFRQLYSAVGLGPLFGWTQWPGIRHALDRSYTWFAKNRLGLTGRCDDTGCRTPAGERLGEKGIERGQVRKVHSDRDTR